MKYREGCGHIKFRMSQRKLDKTHMFVNKVLKDFGYSFEEDIQVDVLNIALSFGIDVIQSDKKSNKIGTLVISADRAEKAIYLHSRRSLETQRYAIAALIGQYVMHYKSGESMFFELGDINFENNLGEIEYFAICLLMPEKSFSSQYLRLRLRGDFQNSINSLKIMYGVKRAFIEFRMEQLRL